MFGDVELTVHCAAELLKRAPEYDYIIAPEAKAIPLGYEMARQSAAERYFVARKGAKAYMQGTFEVTVRSITTKGVQHLVLDAEDAAFIKGKRMLIVDDVISTGESLHAVEELVQKAGGIVAGRMAVLAEGNAAKRDDIIVLAPLPLFTADGKNNYTYPRQNPPHLCVFRRGFLRVFELFRTGRRGRRPLQCQVVFLQLLFYASFLRRNRASLRAAP